MATPWSNSNWLWALVLLFLSHSSISGDNCSRWPSLVSQNLTNVQFNCSGIITGYRLCNRSTDDYISVGLGVWRRGSGVLNTRATYLFDNNTHEGIGLNYNRGDQLMFVIIYYGNTSINEYNCSLPLFTSTNIRSSCEGGNSKPMLYLNVTNDCLEEVHPEAVDTGTTTCAPAQARAPPCKQTAQPTCTATTTDILVSSMQVTETHFTTVTVAASVLTESHFLTMTATNTIPEASRQSCADPLPSNTATIQNASQTSSPTLITPGAAVAIVLGVVLIIQTMVCTLAWVVCFKRRKGKMKREGTDGVIGIEIETAENTAEVYTSSSFMITAPNTGEMQTTQRPSVDSLPESQKSSHGYYNISSIISDYAAPQSTTELKEDSYWKPAATLKGIKAQMKQKHIHTFELQPENITLLKELGKGEFGIVYQGKLMGSPQGPLQVAVKSLHRQEEESRYKLLKEAAIMGQFNHPYVVRLYGVVDQPNKVMLVMEYLSRGDLLNHLIRSRTDQVYEELPLQLLRFCQEIADAMDYLSKKGFIHRDLAARNILLNEEYSAKIADFGMSHDMDDDYYYKPKGGVIPVKWTAPEAILYRKYTTKSDVWSYGMVMYEIWSLGHKPFEEFNINQVLRVFETGYCQPPPPGCPKNIYKLMVDCWNPELHSRSTFEDLTSELTKDPEALLGWREQDKTVSPKAAVLGAPLEEGKHLYQDLQEKYK